MESSHHALIHDPKRRELLPPFSGSPFGDFPEDYARSQRAQRRKQGPGAAAAPRGSGVVGSSAGKQVCYGADEQPTTAQPKPFLKRRTGTGGLSASTLKPATAATGSPERGGATGGSAPRAPPKAGAYRRQKIPPTEFRRFYERGDLPISIQHRSNGRTIFWKVEPEKLDYHHYLPIFFDGLREMEEPYRFIAFQGCFDLLSKGGSKILPTIPQLIIPLKTALNTRDPEIICSVLKIMQKLVVSGDLIGEALVPYYRQLLPVLNLFKSRCKSTGDEIDYGQRKRANMGELIQETLQLLEMHGGEDAFINIKYMIPTYESCVLA